jgi:hypothetical protein
MLTRFVLTGLPRPWVQYGILQVLALLYCRFVPGCGRSLDELLDGFRGLFCTLDWSIIRCSDWAAEHNNSWRSKCPVIYLNCVTLRPARPRPASSGRLLQPEEKNRAFSSTIGPSPARFGDSITFSVTLCLYLDENGPLVLSRP